MTSTMGIWNDSIDRILPWIDQLIGEKDDKTEIKISDIRNMMDNDELNKLSLASFWSRFRQHMLKRGYNITAKLYDDIVIISKTKNEDYEDLVMDNAISSKDVQYEKKSDMEQLKDIMTIVTYGSQNEYDYNIFELVIQKQEEIFKTTGKKIGIKDIVEQAVRAGIDNVK